MAEPAPTIPCEMPDMLPQRARGVVGPYELLVELAAGGMAVVYLARARDGRAVAPLVAIKRPHRHLASDKNFLAMLLDEARLASSIVHENVVKVHELRFDDGEPSIIMDYVEGASLSELWKELSAAGRAFDPRVAARIALDALAGLHAAHELKDGTGTTVGLVHRDVSPHNVLVGTDGRSRLTDFGIAQATDRFQATRTDEVKGKLAYLAPERIDKRRICTKQSDVFALGIVLWECLAGHRLFRGDEAVDTLQEVLHLSIPRLRSIGCEVSAPLDEVVARALSRDLSVRYATAKDFAVALERAVGTANVGTRAQVARLVEAIAQKRVAERQEAVRRAVLDDEAARKLFEESGLAYRPSFAPPAPEATLDSLAPPAPSDRHVLAAGVGFRFSPPTSRRSWLVGGAVAGLLAGVGGTALFASRDTSAVGAEAAAVAPPSSAAAPAPSAPWTVSTTRPVEVRLPFMATHVVVDGTGHDVAPASDVATVDVPVQSGVRHHVVATALDGTVTEVDMIERGGTATLPASRGALTPPASTSSARPPGVVRNGFTRLR